MSEREKIEEVSDDEPWHAGAFGLGKFCLSFVALMDSTHFLLKRRLTHSVRLPFDTVA